jgi:TonB family protein
VKQGMQALSKREREVLLLLVRGHDGKSIAAALGLSVHAVNERLREARRKLGVSSSREAARRLLAEEGGGAETPEKSGDKEIGVAGRTSGDAGGEQPSVPAARADRRLGYTIVGGIMLIAFISAMAAFSPGAGDGPAQAPPARLSRLPAARPPFPFTDADYPAEALKQHAGGRVSYRLRVDAEGRATDCTVTESSGSPVLDLATCRLIIAKARFVPGTDDSGRPVAASLAGAMEWTPPE